MSLYEYIRHRYSDFLLDISRGYVKGAQPLGAYGRVTTAGEVAVPSVLWPNGPFETPSEFGEYFEIVSTSAEDNSAGTGIRSVEIHYLDLTLQQKAAIAFTNGLIPVTSDTFTPPVSDLRFIQCMHVLTAGTLKRAAGELIARRIGGDAQVFSIINTGETRCTSSVRMVPAGKQCIVTGALGSSTSGSAAARTRVDLGSTFFSDHMYMYPVIFIPEAGLGFQDNGFGMNFAPLEPKPEGSLIGMTYVTDKAATITGTWFGFLEDV